MLRSCDAIVWTEHPLFVDGYTPGMVKLSVRRARAEDSEGISHCLGAAFEPYRASYTAGAFADTVLAPEKVLERIATMSVFVAVDEAGEVVWTIGWAMVGGGG